MCRREWKDDRLDGSVHDQGGGNGATHGKSITQSIHLAIPYRSGGNWRTTVLMGRWTAKAVEMAPPMENPQRMTSSGAVEERTLTCRKQKPIKLWSSEPSTEKYFGIMVISVTAEWANRNLNSPTKIETEICTINDVLFRVQCRIYVNENRY